jgi:2-dehydro-3-deoxyphosphogluconate aldolase/(4S)-4-hydroxy-2-oxoglutarate aldolase
MTKHAVRTRIEASGIIPAVRVSSAEDARFAAEAVSQAGLPIVEITMTVPGALEVIAHLAHAMPDLIVGAGTILDLRTAQRCVDAGARFLTSPGLDLRVVEFAAQKDVLAMPGVLTPTEVTAAWQAGADFMKVFPCAHVGGASYIHAMRAPFPSVPLIAAGGVNQQTAADYILAGATAIGVGTELIPPGAVQQRNQPWITELVSRFLSLIQDARSQTARQDAGVDRR